MRIKFLKWLAVVPVICLSSCYPEGPSYTEDYDLVYTNYASEYNFKSQQTYALPDSVVKITGEHFEDPDGNNKPEFVSQPYSQAILSQVETNMSNNGWTRVDKFDNPDVILLVTASTTTNLYYYYDWSYWGWWYPGYYPGWGWYYPYAPAYVTGYKTGSVFMQMLDHTTGNPEGDNVQVVWSSILNGLAEGSTAGITTRLQANINKAFNQSPYLKH